MQKSDASRQAVMLLEDGSVYTGKGFGAEATVVGEIVFNTGMVGYPESMTDPSYAGQVLCFSYPLIGNYGVPSYGNVDRFGLPVNFESDSIKVRGIVAQEHCEAPSHWASTRTISDWMEGERVPGISGVDTRALVSKIRESGVMMCVLSSASEMPSKREMTRTLQKASSYDSTDFVGGVSTKKDVSYGPSGKTVVLVDCGVKYGIIRNVLSRGYGVVRVPFDASYAEIVSHDPAGVIVSNGPGDPQRCKGTVASVARVIDSEIPVLGICLGEQLIGISQGAKTYKLKYGHRGQNKPVVDVTTGRGYVTSQNHGYAIDHSSLGGTPLKPWLVNADDGSVEGTLHAERPCMAVQFHPEASPGPYDTEFIFDRFASMMDGSKGHDKRAIGESIRNMTT